MGSEKVRIELDRARRALAGTITLQAFSPALEQVATEVDCGSAVSNLGRRSDELSLAGLARADACRDGATLRAASAVATTAVIGVLGLVTLAGARRREVMA